MSTKIEYELIVTIVDRGYSDFVVEATRSAGASGGTIVYGRGTGIHEKESILGVSIQPEKELVLTLAKKSDKKKIMQTIVENASLTKEGKGMCFCLPVLNVAGINHLIAEKQAKKSKKTEN